MARRTHTGRRRNEEARLAVLRAAIALLMEPDPTSITIDSLAAAAGVGRQTLYRWWPSKAAILAEALSEEARDRVPDADTGTVVGDLTAFLVATVRAASATPVARALRTIMAEAQHDPHAAEVLTAYTAQRRSAMRALLERGQERGQLAPDADLDLIIDQAFGFVWYRLLVRHAPLTIAATRKLAAGLLQPPNPPLRHR